MKMLKNTPPLINKLLTVLILVFSFSVTTTAQQKDTLRTQLDYLFAPLNKAAIPTGILAENMYQFYNIDNYNGTLTPNNTLDFAQWRLLYSQALSGAYVAPVGLPSVAQLNTSFKL